MERNFAAYTQPFDRLHKPIPLLPEKDLTEYPLFDLPETYEFLSQRDEITQKFILPQLYSAPTQNFIRNMYSKIKGKDLPIRSVNGTENWFSGYLFEQIAHSYLQELQPDVVILSPHETKKLFELNAIKEGVKERIRTVPDGLIFESDLFASKLIGSCEYTIRTNLGSNVHPYDKLNKDKRKQIMQHATGKIGYDFFSRHKPKIQKTIGERLNNLHDELPSTIIYDNTQFTSYIVTPQEKDIPFTHPRCKTIQVPVSTNEIWYTAMSVVRELQNITIPDQDISDEIVLFDVAAD